MPRSPRRRTWRRDGRLRSIASRCQGERPERQGREVDDQQGERSIETEPSGHPRCQGPVGEGSDLTRRRTTRSGVGQPCVLHLVEDEPGQESPLCRRVPAVRTLLGRSEPRLPPGKQGQRSAAMPTSAEPHQGNRPGTDRTDPHTPIRRGWTRSPARTNPPPEAWGHPDRARRRAPPRRTGMTRYPDRRGGRGSDDRRTRRAHAGIRLPDGRIGPL